MILVEIAATKSATEIIYGAIPIPFLPTWSLSVFFVVNGFASALALALLVVTVDNWSLASVKPAVKVSAPNTSVPRLDVIVELPSANFVEPFAI